MSEAQHEKAEWLSVGRAAIRLGTTVPALRKEIKAGRVETSWNSGRAMVNVGAISATRVAAEHSVCAWLLTWAMARDKGDRNRMLEAEGQVLMRGVSVKDMASSDPLSKFLTALASYTQARSEFLSVSTDPEVVEEFEKRILSRHKQSAGA
jgi:hypothetical protein